MHYTVNLADPLGLSHGALALFDTRAPISVTGDLSGYGGSPACFLGGAPVPCSVAFSVNPDAIERIEFISPFQAAPPGTTDIHELAWKAAVAVCADGFGVHMISFTFSGPGVNGKFVGVGPDNVRISVTNDVNRFTLAEIRWITGKPYAEAFTADGGLLRWPPSWFWPFSPNVNYTGTDLPGAAGSIGWLDNQLHELGHSLQMLTGVPETPGVDIGEEFSRCVQKEYQAIMKGD